MSYGEAKSILLSDYCTIDGIDLKKNVVICQVNFYYDPHTWREIITEEIIISNPFEINKPICHRTTITNSHPSQANPKTPEDLLKDLKQKSLALYKYWMKKLDKNSSLSETAKNILSEVSEEEFLEYVNSRKIFLEVSPSLWTERESMMYKVLSNYNYKKSSSIQTKSVLLDSNN